MKVIIRFPTKKALNTVIIGETLNAMKLVLEGSLVQIACHSDVQSSGDATDNVNAVCSASAHEGIGVLRLSASSQAKKRLRSG
jgi:hypothetical protein